MKTGPHAGPGVQTSVLVVSKLVPGLPLACGIFLYGPELRLMFVFLKGLTTTTKTQQRTICGLQSQTAPPGSPQEASTDAALHRCFVCTAQLQGPGHVHLLPQEHLDLGKGSSDAVFQILFLTILFFFNNIRAHPYFSLLRFGTFPIFHKLRQQ